MSSSGDSASVSSVKFLPRPKTFHDLIQTCILATTPSVDPPAAFHSDSVLLTNFRLQYLRDMINAHIPKDLKDEDAFQGQGLIQENMLSTLDDTEEVAVAGWVDWTGDGDNSSDVNSSHDTNPTDFQPGNKTNFNDVNTGLVDLDNKNIPSYTSSVSSSHSKPSNPCTTAPTSLHHHTVASSVAVEVGSLDLQAGSEYELARSALASNLPTVAEEEKYPPPLTLDARNTGTTDKDSWAVYLQGFRWDREDRKRRTSLHMLEDEGGDGYGGGLARLVPNVHFASGSMGASADALPSDTRNLETAEGENSNRRCAGSGRTSPLTESTIFDFAKVCNLGSSSVNTGVEESASQLRSSYLGSEHVLIDCPSILQADDSGQPAARNAIQVDETAPLIQLKNRSTIHPSSNLDEVYWKHETHTEEILKAQLIHQIETLAKENDDQKATITTLENKIHELTDDIMRNEAETQRSRAKEESTKTYITRCIRQCLDYSEILSETAKCLDKLCVNAEAEILGIKQNSNTIVGSIGLWMRGGGCPSPENSKQCVPPKTLNTSATAFYFLPSVATTILLSSPLTYYQWPQGTTLAGIRKILGSYKWFEGESPEEDVGLLRISEILDTLKCLGIPDPDLSHGGKVLVSLPRRSDCTHKRLSIGSLSKWQDVDVKAPLSRHRLESPQVPASPFTQAAEQVRRMRQQCGIPHADFENMSNADSENAEHERYLNIRDIVNLLEEPESSSDKSSFTDEQIDEDLDRASYPPNTDAQYGSSIHETESPTLSPMTSKTEGVEVFHPVPYYGARPQTPRFQYQFQDDRPIHEYLGLVLRRAPCDPHLKGPTCGYEPIHLKLHHRRRREPLHREPDHEWDADDEGDVTPINSSLRMSPKSEIEDLHQEVDESPVLQQRLARKSQNVDMFGNIGDNPVILDVDSTKLTTRRFRRYSYTWRRPESMNFPAPSNETPQESRDTISHSIFPKGEASSVQLIPITNKGKQPVRSPSYQPNTSHFPTFLERFGRRTYLWAPVQINPFLILRDGEDMEDRTAWIHPAVPPTLAGPSRLLRPNERDAVRRNMME